MVLELGLLTVAVGFTVIVKDFVAPWQLFPPKIKVGVTVIVAVIGAVLMFVAINAKISPDPLAGRPMPGVLFVQL